MDSKTVERGSAKLFALEPHDHEGIARALGVARGDYEVKWWWKYGQPAIDRISAVLDITDVRQAPSVLGGLTNLHSAQRQVSFDVFPYGIPVIDGVRVQLRIDQVTGK